MTARALILDQDPLTREKLRRSLSTSSAVEVIGEVSCAEEALAVLERINYNLLITNGAEPALTPAGGVAPVLPEAPVEPEPLARVPVHRDGRTVLVESDAIVFAEAARGYSSLKLADEKVLVSFSLNELERRLRGHFFRVHRSSLVNLRYVRELVPDFRGALVLVMSDRQRSRVEVSRRQARELRRRLGV